MVETGESTALTVITVIVSLVFATIATATSLFNSVNHLRNYTQPTTQRHVVRILLIVPTYAVSSFLSFAFPPASLIFITVRDVYEAYVIYCFFYYLLAQLGGEGTKAIGGLTLSRALSNEHRPAVARSSCTPRDRCARCVACGPFGWQRGELCNKARLRHVEAVAR